MGERTFGYATADARSAGDASGRRGRLRVVADAAATYDTDASHASAELDLPEAGAVDPEVALKLLRRATDAIARADLDVLSDRGLLEHTVDLDRQVTRLEAQRLRHLGEVDGRAAFTEDACVTAGSWFKMRTHRDPNVGSRIGRWTRRLSRFPALRAAFEAGTVTFDHVLVVLRAAKGTRRTAALADHEATLVTLAERGQPRDVKAAVTAICDATDHRDAHCGPDEARELYHARTFRGRGDLRATLDPVTAERLDNLLHAYQRPDPADTDDDDRRSPSQRRHDAFDAILRAAEQHPHAPSVHGARPHLIVYTDLFTLLGRPDLASRATELASGTDIDLRQVIRLLEDAKATFVLGMGPFRPVAFGRTKRTIPDHIRPLLAMIHGHCRGPGCDPPVAWTQATHTDRDWADGGTTELDTTIPGCLPHHQLRDIAGWNVDLDPNTAICTWTGRVPAGREEHRSPDGTTIIYTHPPDP